MPEFARLGYAVPMDSTRLRALRLLPSALVIIAVTIALFASNALTAHTPTGGHAINWQDIESLAITVPAAPCCGPDAADQAHGGATMGAQGDTHGSLLLACGLVALVIIMFVRGVTAAPDLRARIIQRVRTMVSMIEAPVPRPQLAVLCVSRT